MERVKVPLVQKKVCMLGDFAVGKTSLVRRFVEGRFDEKYLSTVGVHISRKSLQRADHRLNLLLWDLAGGRNLTTYGRNYLLGAAGGLVVCDLTRPETLEGLVTYAEQLRARSPAAALLFVGNKVDLVDQRRISEDELEAVANKWAAPYRITSAKTDERVEEAFVVLADLIEGKP